MLWKVFRPARCRLTTVGKAPSQRMRSSMATLAAVKPESSSSDTPTSKAPVSAMLHRSLKSAPPQVVLGKGKELTFEGGHTIMDTTCGAAVACIGYNDRRVRDAMVKQIDKFSYCNSMFFGHPVGEQLADELIRGTKGVMSKAYIMSSGLNQTFPFDSSLN